MRWSLLEPYVIDTGSTDSAWGTLYDTGLDYPAAVFGGDTVIAGRTFAVSPALRDECLAHLDIVESTVGGLYSRIVVTTGRGVTAWAYQYGGGLDLTPIHSGDWQRR